jgi:hypothetical protein
MGRANTRRGIHGARRPVYVNGLTIAERIQTKFDPEGSCSRTPLPRRRSGNAAAENGFSNIRYGYPRYRRDVFAAVILLAARPHIPAGSTVGSFDRRSRVV